MQAGQDLKLADLIVRRREYLEAQRKNRFVFTDLIVGPYADDFHFLYELIQNAEDAGATYLHFELSVDCLRLRYDGKEFSAADVDAITGISNLSNQKKEKESNSIGRFGIGFKSVFKITERPRIRSGKFDFEIEDFILPVVHNETADFGECRTVDFGPFLHRATHPAIQAYRNEAHFQQFAITNGNVNWNDYDLIFPVADLYAGKIK